MLFEQMHHANPKINSESVPQKRWLCEKSLIFVYDGHEFDSRGIGSS